MLLRDRDINSGWDGLGDGTLEERRYYCHNSRYDVVQTLDAAAGRAEQQRYDPHGRAIGSPLADVNHDGTVNCGRVAVWIF